MLNEYSLYLVSGAHDILNSKKKEVASMLATVLCLTSLEERASMMKGGSFDIFTKCGNGSKPLFACLEVLLPTHGV